MNLNSHLSNLLTQLNIGLIRRYRFIYIVNTLLNLKFISFFYNLGLFRTYHVLSDNKRIKIFFKFYLGQAFPNFFKMISRPGKREFWSLKKLSKMYNNHNFSGYYIISTSKGLVTSDVCLLQGHLSGEVLLQVVI